MKGSVPERLSNAKSSFRKVCRPCEFAPSPGSIFIPPSDSGIPLPGQSSAVASRRFLDGIAWRLPVFTCGAVVLTHTHADASFLAAAKSRRLHELGERDSARGLHDAFRFCTVQ